MKTVINNILKDVRVELLQEFTQNFERKAFFAEKWHVNKIPNNRGSLMLRTGSLQKSLKANIVGMGVKFTSHLPYANLHNDGGRIEVTEKMKKFFWAMYYKNGKSEYYKAMALKKLGTFVIIPKRQFIGYHPKLDKLCRDIINDNVAEFLDKNFPNKTIQITLK